MSTVQCKEANSEEVVLALTTLLQQPLEAGKKVLWLISGGSSLPIAVEVSKRLQTVDTVQNLYITLVDDRFEPFHDMRTNWQQLQTLGFVQGKAKIFTIVQPDSIVLMETSNRFNELLTKNLEHTQVRIGQFGIGAGYHTGGILPGSPAAREAEKLAVSYEHEGIRHITITPAMIRQLDIAFINSMGESKRSLVQHFLHSTASIEDEPTQALKTAQQTYLYSDVLP